VTPGTSVADQVNGPGRRLRRRRAFATASAVVLAAALGWLCWPTATTQISLHAGTPRYIVTTVFTGLRIGTADVELAVDRRDPGAVPAGVQEVWIQAVMPTMGHTSGRVPASRIGDESPTVAGKFRTLGLSLMMTGPWQLLVSVTDDVGTEHLSLPFWISG
jgi:hypothetical protein